LEWNLYTRRQQNNQQRLELFNDAANCENENKKAVLSQREPLDAAVNFDTYRILQRQRHFTILQRVP